MSRFERKEKPVQKREPEETPDEVETKIPQAAGHVATQEVLDHIDEVTDDAKNATKDIEALIDEIDMLLEQDPDEFVQNYRQRGGE